jgi:hypothetical protein
MIRKRDIGLAFNTTDQKCAKVEPAFLRAKSLKALPRRRKRAEA